MNKEIKTKLESETPTEKKLKFRFLLFYAEFTNQPLWFQLTVIVLALAAVVFIVLALNGDISLVKRKLVFLLDFFNNKSP